MKTKTTRKERKVERHQEGYTFLEQMRIPGIGMTSVTGLIITDEEVMGNVKGFKDLFGRLMPLAQVRGLNVQYYLEVKGSRRKASIGSEGVTAKNHDEVFGSKDVLGTIGTYYGGITLRNTTIIYTGTMLNEVSGANMRGQPAR